MNTSFSIGSLTLKNRLIQGPLAGFSAAPFRELFYQFEAPAFCVSEMLSANDILTKHSPNSRYLHRGVSEKVLAYQLSGTDPLIMAKAAYHLQNLGADLIDINCGCPKGKIRKKGAGSALLENLPQLLKMIRELKQAISIPLTLKIRIQHHEKDIELAKSVEQAGVDALIIHGRTWRQDYDIPSDWKYIAHLKKQITIPVIANGDIADADSLASALKITNCDAFMISRAGSGKPWLFRNLLNGTKEEPDLPQRIALFLQHVQGLVHLEGEHVALLQSRSLLRYYFRGLFPETILPLFYSLKSWSQLEPLLASILLK